MMVVAQTLIVHHAARMHLKVVYTDDKRLWNLGSYRAQVRLDSSTRGMCIQASSIMATSWNAHERSFRPLKTTIATIKEVITVSSPDLRDRPFDPTRTMNSRFESWRTFLQSLGDNLTSAVVKNEENFFVERPTIAKVYVWSIRKVYIMFVKLIKHLK